MKFNGRCISHPWKTNLERKARMVKISARKRVRRLGSPPPTPPHFPFPSSSPLCRGDVVTEKLWSGSLSSTGTLLLGGLAAPAP
ncbi:hypothetical protein M6B38_331585 [Iris pallida]|uniref:Uncharacterized protein n=1 Tax=Iris pallida TaxID=29817 RepID=A0AAX6H3M0_IRIPA|nr:hypothetical protein M6B38_331585 [Iris pallida]